MALSRGLTARMALALALFAVAAMSVAIAAADAKKTRLKGDDTALTPDAGTFGALTGAGFTVAPVGDAQARDDGSIAFPITGGRVNTKTLRGSIEHSGGLSISRDGTTVVARRFVIDTRSKKPYLTARVGDGRLKLLDLSQIRRDDAGGKIVVRAKATLTKQAAHALNAALHTDVFKAGTPIGTAKVTASA